MKREQIVRSMKTSDSENRFLFTRYFLIVFLIAGSILAGIISILYSLESKDYLTRLKIEEKANVKLQTELINHSLKDIVSDLIFLSQQNELAYLLESADERYADEIAREYLAFSRQKYKYDQIRYLDDTGMEKIRVNFNNGNPVILPQSDLRPKGNRYYFKETITLPHDRIFISPLDLNIEKGEIEMPFKPMIRFGIPILDTSNKTHGIVILNYLGDRLLEPIKEAGRLSIGDIMLVNSDAYWLCSPRREDEWGFMIKERENHKFSVDFPEAWTTIFTSDSSQIQNENGLFTSETITPFEANINPGPGSPEAFGKGDIIAEHREYSWKIISHIPVEKLRSGTSSLLVRLFFLAILLFVFSTIPSWFIAHTIVRRKMHQMALYQSANYDKLTGLPNRSLFLDRLNQEFNQSKRYKRKFAILFIDLDGFKSVNDTLGHDAGDDLLIQVAQKLMDCVRESDTVARLGGDEFTVIINSIISLESAKQVAHKIIQTLATPFRVKGNNVQIGASIGISSYPDHGNDIEILLTKADAAMYIAKNEGKNDYRISAA